MKPADSSPHPNREAPASPDLTAAQSAAGVVLVASAYHLAFAVPVLSPLVLPYLAGLLLLSRQPTARRAFWVGTGAGLLVCAPPMGFLLRVFGAVAPVLWFLIALWHGMFLLLVRGAGRGVSPGWALALAPVFWTGLEYFRCEVWPLRFAWFTAGEAVVDWSGLLRRTGVYGAGTVLMAAAALCLGVLVPAWQGGRRTRAVAGALALAGLLGALSRPPSEPTAAAPRRVSTAGLQLEFPGTPEVLAGLEAVRDRAPGVQLVVLPEYAFDGPVPTSVGEWCRRNETWLVAGGRDPAPPRAGTEASAADFYNTAFVVGPDGEVAFRQAKVQPIQFFQDGRPAPGQAPWPSPWGPLGIAVCYDASFRRVMDPLVGAGSSGLVIPAMDVADWGAVQHRLNARMTRVRAAEYGLPVLRVGSSGISQFVDPRGRETATAPFPGPGEILIGTLDLAGPGRVPPDAWWAPACLGLLVPAAALLGFLRWRTDRNPCRLSPKAAGSDGTPRPQPGLRLLALVNAPGSSVPRPTDPAS